MKGGGKRDQPRPRGGFAQRVADGLPQTVQPLTLHGLDGHDGDDEPLLKRGNVDAEALLFCDVEHGQRNDGGPAEVQNLRDQIEVAVEVAGVRDGQHAAGLDRPLPVAEEDGDGDHLVGRARGQRIGAGQIDGQEFPPIVQKRAQRGFDRHSGIIPRVLAQPGQGVEERSLAGVGVADDGDAGGFGLGSYARRCGPIGPRTAVGFRGVHDVPLRGAGETPAFPGGRGAVRGCP